MILGGELAKRLKMSFEQISERYEFEIDTMEVNDDHVHLFLSAPPRYSSRNCTDHKECLGGDGVQAVSRGEERALGWSFGVMGILFGLLEIKLPLKSYVAI